MESKKLSIIFIFLIAVVLVSGCVGQSPPTINENKQILEQTKFLVYENQTYGIKIKYPENWTKQEGLFGTAVTFVSKESDAFNVGVSDLPNQSVTLSEVTESSIYLLGQFITDFKLIDSKSTVLSKNPAHSLVYTGRQGNFNLKWKQVFTVKNGKSYVVTAAVKKDSEFSPVIEEMISSFEIL